MNVSEEKLKKLKESRDKNRERSYAKALSVIGNDGVMELRRLVDVYDEQIYIWLAGLWEPKTGGFYYSESARDNDGFLPDLESTAQALHLIIKSGLASGYDGVPMEMKGKIVDFVRELQDPCDGFFYLPQWGKAVLTQRRGRDLMWASNLLQGFGASAKYPSPLDAKRGGTSVRVEHLSSLDAFRAYLAEFENPDSKYYIHAKSYYLGNLLASQAKQIKAAGDEYIKIVCDFLNSHQYAHNGLWEDRVDYDPVNGLMKIGSVYSTLGVEIPNAEAALGSAIEIALRQGGAVHMCCIYNPFAAMTDLIHSIETVGGKGYAEKLRKNITDRAPELITVAREKLLTFKQADGGFSYKPEHSSAKSQGSPVAVPNTRESDVNATKIAASSVLGCMCAALGIERPALFTRQDGELFFELIGNAPSI